MPPSLQTHLLRLQLWTMLLFAAGAAVFCWRMIVLDQVIERQFDIGREIEVVLRTGDLVNAVTTGRLADADALRAKMRAGFQMLPSPDERTSGLIHIAERVLADPKVSQASIAVIQGEISDLLMDLGEKSANAEDEYRGQRLWVAFAWTLILALPLGLAFLPLRLSAGVISGIRQLSDKIKLGRDTGDSSKLVIDRADEIGTLGRAIDEMFTALLRREQEVSLARQLQAEQEKMGDMVSFTGGIAHEIANPLAVILANLDTLDCDNEAAPQIEGIRECLERIQVLLREVTSFASGDDHLDLVDVNGVVTSVFRIVRLDDRTRGCHFSSFLDPDIPAIRFSRPALMLSLFSLSSFGAEIIRDTKGAMIISTKLEPGHVSVSMWASRAADAEDAGDGYLRIAETESRSVLQSMHRVLRGFGGELAVSAMHDNVREYRVTLPLTAIEGTDGHD